METKPEAGDTWEEKEQHYEECTSGGKKTNSDRIYRELLLPVMTTRCQKIIAANIFWLTIVILMHWHTGINQAAL